MHPAQNLNSSANQMNAKFSNRPGPQLKSLPLASSSNRIKKPNKMDDLFRPQLWNKRAATTVVKHPGQRSQVSLRTGPHLPRQILSVICLWLSWLIQLKLQSKWSKNKIKTHVKHLCSLHRWLIKSTKRQSGNNNTILLSTKFRILPIFPKSVKTLHRSALFRYK